MKSVFTLFLTFAVLAGSSVFAANGISAERSKDVDAINKLQANMWWGCLHRADGIAVDMYKLQAVTSKAAACVFNSRDKEALTWLMTTNSKLLSDELKAIQQKVRDGEELTAEEYELFDDTERLRAGFLGTYDEWIRSRDTDTLHDAFYSLDGAVQNAVLREASRGNLLEERKLLFSNYVQADAWTPILPSNYVFNEGATNVLKEENALHIPAAANDLLQAGMTTWRIQEVLSGQGQALSHTEIAAIQKVKGDDTDTFVEQLRGMQNLTAESKGILYQNLGTGFNRLFRNAWLNLESYNYSSRLAPAQYGEREAALATLFGADTSNLQVLLDNGVLGGEFVRRAAQGILLNSINTGGGQLNKTQLETEINEKGLKALMLLAANRTHTPETAIQLITGADDLYTEAYQDIAKVMGITLDGKAANDVRSEIYNLLQEADTEQIKEWVQKFQKTASGEAVLKLMHAQIET